MTLANQPASRGDSQPPQKNPLSQLQQLDRSWTVTIAACLLLEVATVGMDNPLINGIRWVDRAGIVALSSFKFCRYRIGSDIRAEIEEEMRSQRIETAANAQKYRYQIEDLQGTNQALSAQLETLTVELERLQSVDQDKSTLDSSLSALNRQLELRQDEIADLQQALLKVSRQNKAIKKHTVEFGIASRAVIVDLVQNSLLQKKQTADQSAQLTDQSATLQRLYEGYQQALKQNQDATELVRAQQREHEETAHHLRLQIRELQTEVRVSKKSNRFAESDDD